MQRSASSKWRILSLLYKLGLNVVAWGLVLVPIFPVIWIVSTSLKPFNALLTTSLKIIPENYTFNAYKWVFFESKFWVWLRNSLVVSTATVVFVLLLGVPAAYALSRMRFFGKKGFLYTFIFVQFVPAMLALIPFYNILRKLHLLNTLTGITLIYSSGLLPFCIWNMKAFFDTLPIDIDEAALIDGASFLRAMFSVVLPVATPGIAVTAFFSFLASWNEFVVASVVLMPDKYTLPVGLYSLATSSYEVNWVRFAAMSVMLTIPAILVFTYLQRYLRAGYAIGAVKG